MEYIVTEETGPAHDKNFEITAFIGGRSFQQGNRAYKESQQRAAERSDTEADGIIYPARRNSFHNKIFNRERKFFLYLKMIEMQGFKSFCT